MSARLGGRRTDLGRGVDRHISGPRHAVVVRAVDPPAGRQPGVGPAVVQRVTLTFRMVPASFCSFWYAVIAIEQLGDRSLAFSRKQA